MEMEVFFDKVNEWFPQVNKVIRRYFEGKFLDKKCLLRVPSFQKNS
jgi:hypothetical protein